MSGFIRWVDLPDGRQIEIDNGTYIVWRGNEIEFKGPKSSLPEEIIQFLNRPK